MAHDLLSRRAGGKDWSCGIGDEPPPGRSSIAPLVAGAAVVGLAAAGVYAASSMGGGPPSRGAPPTMVLRPRRGGYSVNEKAAGYFGS